MDATGWIFSFVRSEDYLQCFWLVKHIYTKKWKLFWARKKTRGKKKFVDDSFSHFIVNSFFFVEKKTKIHYDDTDDDDDDVNEFFFCAIFFHLFNGIQFHWN